MHVMVADAVEATSRVVVGDSGCGSAVSVGCSKCGGEELGMFGADGVGLLVDEEDDDVGDQSGGRGPS